ncbi:hypothetical protein N7468_006588 [Penicillium chermesinum]|uniref:Uncharacterized protein n=1 Tax=Penicillium chermesinum TaxID=63820 RepID=A0A9W9TJU0_9EURO|nr:uncharacterized protein N7468_006588 [Penicillium chermesinum]KAJ5225363.1 hypothetical protein N7468_006588 [Penicillium chermesinum]
MFNYRISEAGLVLLVMLSPSNGRICTLITSERWQEDSPLSIDAQREGLSDEFVKLGARCRAVVPSF